MPPSVQPALNPDSSVNFEEFLVKLDGRFKHGETTALEHFRFDLDGLGFDVRRIAHENSHHLLISAFLGSLPFSIESVERRDAIKTIVLASQKLPNVRLSIDPSSKIVASGLFEMESTVMPDFIFYPLILFLQEAKPTIDLIGSYLQAQNPVQPPPPDAAKTDASADGAANA